MIIVTKPTASLPTISQEEPQRNQRKVIVQQVFNVFSNSTVVKDIYYFIYRYNSRNVYFKKICLISSCYILPKTLQNVGNPT